MRILNAECGETLLIGRQGEHQATEVRFDVSSWIGSFGDTGTLAGLYQRSQDDQPYPVAVSVDGGVGSWIVSSLDTERKGYGKIELTYVVGDTIVKSAIWGTYVAEAMGQSIEPPDPVPPWLDEVLKAAARAEAAAKVSEEKAGQAVRSAANADGSANRAHRSADYAGAAATKAESWAVGGTGTRPGEDEDNAKRYAERAEAAAAEGVNKAYVQQQDALTLQAAKDYADKAGGGGFAAVCYDVAENPTSEPNTWYVPKTMPRPSGEVGMLLDVLWENGLVGGLGYDVSLVWGEPGGADNEVIVDKAGVSSGLTGEYSIPTEGAVRYQLIEQNGRKRWHYVSGDLIPRQYSTDAAASAADKPVHGLQLGYLPGMEIFVQLDKGNTADVMRLVPDEGETLPVYGNGGGRKTGPIPAGYILNLKNAGSYWQIINRPADLNSPAHTTMVVTALKEGGSGYKADHTSTEIINHANAGGIVVLRYTEPTGKALEIRMSGQTPDRQAWFFQTFKVPGEDKVKRVDATVDYAGNVALAEEVIDVATQTDLAAAIGALGTVFDYKGSKPSKSALPSTGNATGDVWFVEDESVGYIWLDSGKWEPFGPAIDLTGYVPKTTKVNGKALDKDITLTASDVKARPESWMPTAAEVGARPDDWMPTAAQVGAHPNSWRPTWNQVTGKPSTFPPAAHQHTYKDIIRGTNIYANSHIFPIDRGVIEVMRANRAAFMPDDGVLVEYSTDGGKTWTNYPASAEQKAALTAMKLSAGGFVFKLGNRQSGAPTMDDQLRITLIPIDRYTSADTFFAWLSTNGNAMACDLERSTIGAPTTFQPLMDDVPVGGWSGPNEINFKYGTFGGSSGQTANFYAYRATFKYTKTGKAAGTVSDVRLYGDNCWRYSNPMMAADHLYEWDATQTAFFKTGIVGGSPASSWAGRGFALQSGAGTIWAKEKIVVGGNSPSDGAKEVATVAGAPTEGQFAVFRADGSLQGVTLPNLDKEAR